MHAHALQPDLGLALARARLYERLAESAIERGRSSSRANPFPAISRSAGAILRALGEPIQDTPQQLPRPTR